MTEEKNKLLTIIQNIASIPSERYSNEYIEDEDREESPLFSGENEGYITVRAPRGYYSSPYDAYQIKFAGQNILIKYNIYCNSETLITNEKIEELLQDIGKYIKKEYKRRYSEEVELKFLHMETDNFFLNLENKIITAVGYFEIGGLPKEEEDEGSSEKIFKTKFKLIKNDEE